MQYICSTSGGREHGQRKREGGTSGDDGRNETLPTKHISIRRKGRRMNHRDQRLCPRQYA